jgi:phosphotransferase system  glucose/maltose/N-acetylglucosamine-specific IIC component
MILPKGYVYYGWAVILYILFLGVAGIGIMLYVGRTKIQNTTVAAVGLYLLMAGLVPFGYTMPPVGFVHALLYAVAFVFFFTREDTVEREPVETLDYSNVRAE